MGRFAIPAEVAAGSATAKSHPERYDKSPAKSSAGLGDPPAGSSETFVAIWREIESNAVPGVLTGGDRVIFEQVVALVVEFRKDRGKFSAANHGKLATLLAHLGMTPSGRRNVPAPKGASNGKGKDNGFDDF